MESVLRAVFTYFFLLLLMRIAGNRTLSEMTMFDFILLLIVGDSSQQAITGNDYSIINAVIVISTLILIDIVLTYLKFKSKVLEKTLDGVPVILIHNGKLQKNMLQLTKIDEEDILEAARKWRGIEKLSEIKIAILEKDGEITIVPNK